MPALALVLAVSACRQPNPWWQGPAAVADSEGASATEASGSGTATDTGTTSSSGDDELGPTTGLGTTGIDETDTGVDACAALTPLGVGPCPSACTDCVEGRCVVDCGSVDCEDPVHQCPADWPCELRCEGECRNETLSCPSDGDCTVICSGGGACRDATVQCGNAPCTVLCSNDANACRNLSVECGSADARVQCEGNASVTLEPLASSSCACEALDCD